MAGLDQLEWAAKAGEEGFVVERFAAADAATDAAGDAIPGGSNGGGGAASGAGAVVAVRLTSVSEARGGGSYRMSAPVATATTTVDVFLSSSWSSPSSLPSSSYSTPSRG